MKKIFLIIFLLSLFLTSIPEITQAGLVPCGPGTGEPVCKLCHFFVMFDRIIKFLLLPPTGIVPILAALMLAIGGFMYIIAFANLAEGGPEMLSRAKKLFSSVVIGLLIIYGAWVIIGLFLEVIGLAEWTTQMYQNWWKQGFYTIPCP